MTDARPRKGRFWTMMARPSMRGAGMTKQEKRVIFASSLGTVFEWYDFYLYATLAPFFAALFFPPGNDTAALLSAFATYAAGFLIRPVGARRLRPHRRPRRPQVHVPDHDHDHGRRDLRGRPVADLQRRSAGSLRSCSSSLRLVQGLALGGEYGGAATYVAEHARPAERGFCDELRSRPRRRSASSSRCSSSACAASTWTRRPRSPQWGWRLPFLVSVLLLVFSVYIRLRSTSRRSSRR